MRHGRFCIRLILILVLCLPLAGCGIGYYLQAAAGQFELWRLQRPIEDVIADPATSPALAARLQYVLEARRFAIDVLGLPDNDSYTRYVALNRDSVVWNVIAVPEFSLQPHRWCAPVAGCVSYRGFFSRQRAEAEAARMAARGYDTRVVGVAAYSTLGWFSDPLVSTMLAGTNTTLAATIFHELAHQRLYVAGDTAFNEAFATAVEQYATRLWLTSRGEEAVLRDYERRLERRVQFDDIQALQRARLVALYARTDLNPEQMRAEKAQSFEQLRADYRDLRQAWEPGPHFDVWFARELNNADMLAQAAYRQWLPAFQRLLEQTPNLEAFFIAVENLAALPPAERNERLATLMAVPVLEEPALEEPIVEEPIGEESVGEESIGEESIGEESIGEESIGEESIGEESIGEESIGEESIGEESVAEESVAEEPAEERSEEP